MGNRYDWKVPGLYKISADVAGEQIEKLYQAKGEINADDVVKLATSKTNPLHSCFEWSDDVAAVRYRESQARILIGNLVTVMVCDSERDPQPVRAFVHIRSKDESGYKPIAVVVSDKVDTEYMLERARSELRNFSAKYNTLTELTSLLKAIDEVLNN